jgi:hypothetical protein
VNEYLDERGFCARYHLSQRTAQRWRIVGIGPPFVRAGLRRVLYRLSDCEAWAARQTHPHRAAEIAAAAPAVIPDAAPRVVRRPDTRTAARRAAKTPARHAAKTAALAPKHISPRTAKKTTTTVQT